MRYTSLVRAILSTIFALAIAASRETEALGGHDRDKHQREIEQRFEWVMFGGEYHPWQIVAIGLDAAFFSGGEISSTFAENEAKKFGIDFASRLASEPKKKPIASGVMKFKIWEKPFGIRVDLGEKYVPYIGVLKEHVPQPPSIKPDPHGYTEFRRRLEEVYSGRAGLPALGDSIEAKWIRYIVWHCVGNPSTRDGYKEFRRRLDVAYQYRYAPEDFDKNYKGKPNLDLDTIPPAFPSSQVGSLLKDFIWHCVGNPDGEAGYREFHRRVAEEIYPKAMKVLSGTSSADALWTLYIMSHLAGNFPVIER